MALLQQVFCCHVAALLMVEQDLVAGEVVHHTVDHHIGHRQMRKLIDQHAVVCKLIGNNQEDAVHPTRDEKGQQVQVVFGQAIGVGNEQGIPLGAATLLQVLGKRREEAALDVRRWV